MTIPRLQKAELIPMENGEPNMDAKIQVQFNPETLKVGLSNTLEAENQGNGNTSAAQFVSKSESTLSLTLVFDSTLESPRSEEAREEARAALAERLDPDSTEFETALADDTNQAVQQLDVRTRTKAIADLFMQPQNPEAEQPAPPKICRFQWGTFAFVGMVSSYDETLDFFSPEGIPLRAQLALTLKEDRYQFEQVAQPEPDVREQPRFSPGGGSLPDAAKNAGKSPKDWRDMALFNGIESPRLSASLSLSAPGISLSGSASLGGAGIAAGGISGGLSAGIGGGGFSASASGPSLSAGLSGGISGGLSAGLQGGVSAGISGSSASFSASAAPAKASFSVGGSSAVGTDVPGAFISMGGTGARAQAKAAIGGFQAQQNASFAAGASGGLSGGVTASGGFSGGASTSAGAGGRLAAQAQASADFDFDTA